MPSWRSTRATLPCDRPESLARMAISPWATGPSCEEAAPRASETWSGCRPWTRRLQQAEPAGQSGDQGVSLAEPGVEVGDQICDQRAQLSVLLTGIPGQHPGDSLVVIGGHRLPVVQHRARPVVDFRAGSYNQELWIRDFLKGAAYLPR